MRVPREAAWGWLGPSAQHRCPTPALPRPCWPLGSGEGLQTPSPPGSAMSVGHPGKLSAENLQWQQEGNRHDPEVLFLVRLPEILNFYTMIREHLYNCEAEEEI